MCNLVDAELDVVAERRDDRRLEPDLGRRILELGHERMPESFVGGYPVFRNDPEQSANQVQSVLKSREQTSRF
jgi:hypothetical protein